MFDKSLHDLVRGIRNHKDNEVWFEKFSISKNELFCILGKIYQWSDWWN
jgi:hypothetical protein